MKRYISSALKVAILLILIFNFQLSNAQIRARQVKPETCSIRNDGEAEVTFGSNANPSLFNVLWTLKDGSTRTSAKITGLAAGQYHVKVTPKQCPSVIVFEGYVGINRTQDCPGPHVSISGASYAESCETPSVTLTSHAWGGTPPLRVSWSERTVSGSGHYCIGCSVIDSNGLRETSYFNVYLKKLECSQDPNEIAGPTGYNDSLHFVNKAEKMNYNISFENDPDFATAPATRVSITYPVPANQSISSFRLSDFGFGSHIFTVPSNSTSYSNRLDVSDDLGIWVDVTAGIDIINNNLYWIFQSIDPATGFEPASSQMGFLPVNDSIGSGEGYVSFLISPKNNVHTGDTVSVDATIVFDDNAPIPTNKWLNTFDVEPPTSTLSTQISESDSLVANFTFSATDDNGGSGVDYIELYVGIDNGIYQYVSSCPADSTLSYTLEEGHKYRFASSAVDFVGNHESLKDIPDTIIDNNNAPTDILLTNTVFYENDPIGTTVGQLLSMDNDITNPFTYALVEGDGDDDNALFRIEDGELKTNAIFSCNGRYEYTVRIRTTDVSGLSFEKALEIAEIQQNFKQEVLLQRDICQGSSILFGTQNYTVAGTYTDSLQTFLGCDSIVTMQLRVHPVYSVTDQQVACDSMTWHGTTYTASNNSTTDMMHTTMGCDSLVTLNLTVNYANTGTDIQNVCDSYTWHGTIYTTSTNTPTFTSQNAAGCDSVTTLNLTIRYSNTGTETHDVCDSYNWHGNTYTASTNTPTFTSQNAAGCDSVTTLHLTVRHSTSGVETITACDNYTWWNTNYTNSTNTPTHLLTNAAGCDSTATLNLTVNYSNSGIENQNVCDSYTWHGTTYTASTNTPTFTSLNAAGCDSVTTLNLTVRYSSTGSESQTACDSYTWHGTIYTTGGTPTYQTTNAAGCDSTVTLNLTINYSSTSSESQTACDSYTWHGTTYTTGGTPTYQTTNAAGCDSTVTLNLAINYSNTGTDVQTACDSYTWHGTTYTASNNTATFVATNVAGCDSTVTLHLTVNYSNSGDTTATACDSFTWWNTNYTNSTNDATHVFTNAAGCDSVVTLHLTVNYSSTGDTTATACDSFTWWNTNYTNSTNDATHVFTNATGCDSTVTLHLTINYSSTGTDVQTACDEFVWIDGNTYTVGGNGIATYTTTNAAGCDSVVTLNLTLNHSVTVYDSLTLANSDLPYNYHGNTVNGAGDYTFDGTTAEGCDSTTLLHVEILEGIDVNDPLAGLKVFPNPTRGTLTIDAEDVLAVEVFDLAGRKVATFEGVNTFDITNLASGTYTLRIQTSRGDTVRRIVKK